MTDNNPHFRAVITVFNLLATCALLVGCVQEYGPGPGPSPTPNGEFRVLVLYETADNLTAGQIDSMSSGSVLEWLTTNAANKWRMFDDDVKLDYLPEWKPLVEQAKSTTGDMPKVVVFGRGKPRSYPLPESAAEMLALLQKAKG